MDETNMASSLLGTTPLDQFVTTGFGGDTKGQGLGYILLRHCHCQGKHKCTMVFGSWTTFLGTRIFLIVGDGNAQIERNVA